MTHPNTETKSTMPGTRLNRYDFGVIAMARGPQFGNADFRSNSEQTEPHPAIASKQLASHTGSPPKCKGSFTCKPHGIILRRRQRTSSRTRRKLTGLKTSITSHIAAEAAR